MLIYDWTQDDRGRRKRRSYDVTLVGDSFGAYTRVSSTERSRDDRIVSYRTIEIIIVYKKFIQQAKVYPSCRYSSPEGIVAEIQDN